MRSLGRAILGVLAALGIEITPAPATSSDEVAASRFTATSNPDDSHWSNVGGPQELTFNVHAFARYRGDLAVGGEFLWISGERVNAIATWTGSAWEPLAQGVEHGGCPGIPCYPRVLALLAFGDDLIVGGNFIKAGGRPASYIARWDGTSWHPLGPGVDNQVYALAEYQGEIIAGGLFLNAGGQPANYIARWDGTSWHPLGTGMDWDITHLTVHGGRLIAGGWFSAAGGSQARHIAAWDGTSWQAMGNGSQTSPASFGLFEGELLADGEFLNQETSQVFTLARWDGASWVQFGPIVWGPTLTLEVYRGKLIRGCSGPWRFVERWDGAAWQPLGSGTDQHVRALFPTETSLYVGGEFLSAGGKTAWFIARWDDVITPVTVEDLAAAAEGDAVRVSWRLSSQAVHDVRRIFVERADDRTGPYLDRTGALAPDLEMSFTDADALPGRAHWYRLRIEMRDGSVSLAGPVEGGAAARSVTRLDQPMDLGGDEPVAIRYRIGGRTSAPVRLEIFTPTGNLLRVVHQGVASPGEHLSSWDRRSESGSPVARGVYLVRLATQDTRTARKLVLLHR